MDILFYGILFVVGMIVGNELSKKAAQYSKNLGAKKNTYENETKMDKIFSKLIYIFLGGIVSILLTHILKINMYNYDLGNMIIYIFSMLYISTLILIAGIDRAYVKIEKNVLAFGIITSIIYMLYLCVVDLRCAYLCAIYLIIYIVLLIIDTFLLKKYATDSYIVNILLELCLILSFTDLRTLTCTIIMLIIAIILYVLFMKKKNKKSGNKKLRIKDIPFGYFIAASNIMVLIMIRIFENYFIYKI